MLRFQLPIRYGGRRWVRHCLYSVFLLLVWTGVSTDAAAHVKWFCAFDVSESPKGLDWVLDKTFICLLLVSSAVFTVAGLIENSILGRAIVWSLDRVTARVRGQTDALMRATYGAFFVSLWSIGGIILTPELRTPVAAISWLQLAIAVCFIWRQTLILAAVGMIILYGYAIEQYGLFHLMDYPIFLGAAGYFVLGGRDWTPCGLMPLDVVRYGASITLMWASVEKWGYPQWTYPLFVSHPEMSMGIEVAFYMKAAGVVEFSLAFALSGTPLMRRTAAIILASMFVTAILEFGKIDAIGHAPIIIVMLAIAADTRPGRQHSFLIAPAYYFAAFGIVVAVYYAGHAVSFPAGGL